MIRSTKTIRPKHSLHNDWKNLIFNILFRLNPQKLRKLLKYETETFITYTTQTQTQMLFAFIIFHYFHLFFQPDKSHLIGWNKIFMNGIFIFYKIWISLTHPLALKNFSNVQLKVQFLILSFPPSTIFFFKHKHRVACSIPYHQYQGQKSLVLVNDG